MARTAAETAKILATLFEKNVELIEMLKEFGAIAHI